MQGQAGGNLNPCELASSSSSSVSSSYSSSVRGLVPCKAVPQQGPSSVVPFREGLPGCNPNWKSCGSADGVEWEAEGGVESGMGVRGVGVVVVVVVE